MIDGPVIAVSATEHPDLDDWVRDLAESEAWRNGWALGQYLGREDVLGPERDADLCCHLFRAITP